MEMIVEPTRKAHLTAHLTAGQPAHLTARQPANQAAQQAPARGNAVAAASAAGPGSRTAQSGEFLTFRLGAEEYGIDILCVQEIRSYEQPTRIANAPAFVKGVTNLRGVIVPIIDLRLRLGCETVECNAFAVVVVLKVRGRVVGAVVDSVSDVLALAKDDIKPAPESSSSVDTSYITGLGTLKSGAGERTLILMDIEGLMSSADMGLVGR